MEEKFELVEEEIKELSIEELVDTKVDLEEMLMDCDEILEMIEESNINV